MSVNPKVAAILYEIGEILTIKGDRFRSRAYSMAAQRVTALTEDIRSVYKRNELDKIPGIGKSIASTISEYLESGESVVLQELRESLPQGVPQMIELEGIGPKIAMRLHHELGVVSLETLEKAARNQRIRALKGFGPKSEENILKSIEEYKSRSTRFLLGSVLPIIQGIITYLLDSPEVRKVEVAGSARRRKETVGDLDVLVSSIKPEDVTEYFVSMKPVERILSKGSTKSTVILKNHLQVDLRVIPPESYGAALQYFTGSKEHNVKLRTISVKEGFKLNEYGLFKRENNERVAAEEEKSIYEALGMRWIPPELRENTGEIEAAIENKLPNLVQLKNIRGDLHVHTNWSDGGTEIEKMVKKAVKMEYEFISITDHSKTLAIANGLDENRLIKQGKEIEILQDEYPEIRILRGTECEILSDGSLDFSDQVLSELDFVIGGIHSGFKQDEDSMTNRLVEAIHNEYIKAVAHPTGRLIQKRSPYQLNLEKVFETAFEQNVMMEINCYPSRLDLSDVNSRMASEIGVILSLGSDAHTPSEMEFMPLGVSTARRGWLEPNNVANTWDLKHILEYRK